MIKVRILLIVVMLMALMQTGSAHVEGSEDSVIIAEIQDKTHVFKPVQLIVPGAFIALGTFGKSNGWIRKETKYLQNDLQNDHHKAFGIDEYTPYVPVAATYALNVFGVRGQHNYKDLTIISAMAYVMELAMTEGSKHVFNETRPNGKGDDSFPSGHTAVAFTGATILWEEYKDVSPWIGVSGYAVASGTAFLRMYNNKHYLQDVIAGAGIGILSARLAYWLYPVIFHHNVSGEKTHSAYIFGSPFVGAGGVGCTALLTF